MLPTGNLSLSAYGTRRTGVESYATSDLDFKPCFKHISCHLRAKTAQIDQEDHLRKTRQEIDHITDLGFGSGNSFDLKGSDDQPYKSVEGPQSSNSSYQRIILGYLGSKESKGSLHFYSLLWTHHVTIKAFNTGRLILVR